MFREACEMLRCAGDEHNAERNVVVEAVMIHQTRALMRVFLSRQELKPKIPRHGLARYRLLRWSYLARNKNLKVPGYEFTGWCCRALDRKETSGTLTRPLEHRSGSVSDSRSASMRLREASGRSLSPRTGSGIGRLDCRCPDLGIEYSGGATGLSRTRLSLG